MKLSVIDYNGKGTNDEKWYAARVLAYTKNTRLNMTPEGFDRFMEMPLDEIRSELLYMATTIPSSWEFVSITFAVEGLSRAAAQQLTRSRRGSYAMQSQRVTDMSSATFHNPFEIGTDEWRSLDRAHASAMQHYAGMLAAGMQLQDARGALPLDTHCNIVFRFNLRDLIDLIRARSSLRVQGEYGELVERMKVALISTWPWSVDFLRDKNQTALNLLEEAVQEVGLATGAGTGWKIAKAMDLIRGGK